MTSPKGSPGSKKGRTQSYPYKYTEKDNGQTGKRVTRVRLTPKKGAMGYTTITRGVKGASVGRKTTITNKAMTVRPSIGSGVKKGTAMRPVAKKSTSVTSSSAKNKAFEFKMATPRRNSTMEIRRSYPLTKTRRY